MIKLLKVPIETALPAIRVQGLVKAWKDGVQGINETMSASVRNVASSYVNKLLYSQLYYNNIYNFGSSVDVICQFSGQFNSKELAHLYNGGLMC